VLLCAQATLGESWQSRLQDGSRVEVDPRTNRATVIGKSGVATPLWDGVHRLENGSTVTIREGIIVPNVGILESRRGQLPDQGSFVVEGASPCIILQRKVCGLHDECGGKEACTQAKQLVQFDQEEIKERRTGSAFTFRQMPTQCRQGLQDESWFAACETRQIGETLTLCEELVTKTCGARNSCIGQPSCSMARQLMEMEYQERLSSFDPDAETFSTGQCRKAFWDEKSFYGCPQ
jgi:hypothetical protein